MRLLHLMVDGVSSAEDAEMVFDNCLLAFKDVSCRLPQIFVLSFFMCILFVRGQQDALGCQAGGSQLCAFVFLDQGSALFWLS